MRLVPFAVAATDADALGDEPVWHDGKVVGWVTSGGYGHSVQQSLALGYIPKELAESEGFEIEILGERRPAVRLSGALFDPDGVPHAGVKQGPASSLRVRGSPS